MKEFEIEERVDQAIRNFESGFNCAQSVFLAYCDIFELDIVMANQMTASFGGGIGKMHEVCGTVTAMAMLAGFKYPVIDPNDKEAKKENNKVVQLMAEKFKDRHGTIICRSLLKTTPKDNTLPTLCLRPIEQYAKRPCIRLVEEAAYISGKMLKEELDQ